MASVRIGRFGLPSLPFWFSAFCGLRLRLPVTRQTGRLPFTLHAACDVGVIQEKHYLLFLILLSVLIVCLVSVVDGLLAVLKADLVVMLRIDMDGRRYG